MCDSATMSILEQIVRQFAAEQRPNGETGKMFTALDVSRTAQNSHGIRERHMNMKNDVHTIFNAGIYTPDGRKYVRTTIHLPNVPVDPWLMYPDGDDPNEYVSAYPVGGHTGLPTTFSVPAPQLPSSSSSAVSTAALAKSTTIADGDDADDDTLPDNVKRTDRRGRVWIPVTLISALGLKPGDVTYAVRGVFGITNVPAVSIKANLGPSDTEAVVYKVDPHGNIAVSKGCLVEAGVISNTVEVTGDPTAIIVRDAVVPTSPTAIVDAPVLAAV